MMIWHQKKGTCSQKGTFSTITGGGSCPLPPPLGTALIHILGLLRSLEILLRPLAQTKTKSLADLEGRTPHVQGPKFVLEKGLPPPTPHPPTPTPKKIRLLFLQTLYWPLTVTTRRTGKYMAFVVLPRRGSLLMGERSFTPQPAHKCGDRTHNKRHGARDHSRLGATGSGYMRVSSARWRSAECLVMVFTSAGDQHGVAVPRTLYHIISRLLTDCLAQSGCLPSLLRLPSEDVK